MLVRQDIRVVSDTQNSNGQVAGVLPVFKQIRYLPQKVNRPQGVEMLGNTRTGANETKAHIQNFLDSIRGAAEPNCPFETGFRVAVACRMAVDSYRQGRTLRWDAGKEEIV